MRRILNFSYLFFISCIFFLLYTLYQIFAPNSDFLPNSHFVINSNEKGSQIFENLEKANIIRSIFWAKVTTKILTKNKFYKGEYEFDKPVSTYDAIKIITSRPISLAVLIPEGFTKQQIADRLAKYIIKFDKKKFLENSKEGYLFPETYYFFKFSTTEEILKEFSDKFNQNMLEKFGKMPSNDQIIIASMLEREAKDFVSMQQISGIIQNRLKINMALQIDATVLYGNGAWKNRVLYSDLKTKNDYNTYQKVGLPIGPISNPGINAIKAAMNPLKSNYMYYLTGKDGNMYYAVTHDEHIANKQKYLR